MAVVERISTGSTLTWGGATVLKVRDFEYGGSCTAEDVTGQEDAQNRDYVAGLRELDAFRFTIVYDKAGDTVHDALDDDFIAGTKRTTVFTGPDGVALTYDCYIEDLSEAKPLGGVLMADLVLMLGDRDTVSAAGV